MNERDLIIAFLKDMGFENVDSRDRIHCPSWAYELAEKLIDQGWIKKP